MRRLWRWLCCRTGHHRETVRSAQTQSLGWLGFVCMDCPYSRTLWCGPTVRTPSRRYALRGKA
jgi:hypothetical protein